MDIKDYIKEFLLLNDGIVIPGFGGFVSEYESAVFDVNENKFLPPSKKIVFKPEFSFDDNKLAEFISQKEGIDQESAKKEINQFVLQIKSNLAKKTPIIIKDIGILSQSAKGGVLFEQDRNINILTESFGLKSVKTKLFSEKKELKQEIKIVKEKKSLKKPLLIASSIIVLFTLLFLTWNFTQGFTEFSFVSSMFSTNNETIGLQEATTKSVEYLDSIARSDSIKANINKTIDVTTGKKEALYYSDQKEALEANQPEFSKFYIIAGSFQSLNKAEIFSKELNKKGFTTEIIHSENNLYRISIATYSSEGIALKELYKLRTDPEIKQVWILKSN